MEGREGASNILSGEEDRLLVVVGPCSIHDVGAAKEYADRLLSEAHKWRAELLLMMRVYFEKPRTTIGWKVRRSVGPSGKSVKPSNRYTHVDAHAREQTSRQTNRLEIGKVQS
eukprot:GHVU01068312.1.p3 GENE.GHVU01068312.1~~GHVU01068312.1.p3  ORF type:complete len:113 (-),score=13.53 GHVU01068312.1:164-502(-)